VSRTLGGVEGKWVRGSPKMLRLELLNVGHWAHREPAPHREPSVCSRRLPRSRSDVRAWVNAPQDLHQVEGQSVSKVADDRGVVSGKSSDLEVVTQLWVGGFDSERLREDESKLGVVLGRP
jgi:hypothetical protein